MSMQSTSSLQPQMQRRNMLRQLPLTGLHTTLITLSLACVCPIGIKKLISVIAECSRFPGRGNQLRA